MSDPVLNVTADLIRHARLRPGAPALASEGRVISYRDLDRLVWCAAAVLDQHGLRRGDTVALTYGDEALLAIAILGAARLGLTFVVLPKSATMFQRRAWAEAARCCALASDDPARCDIGLPTVTLGAAQCFAARRVSVSLLDECPVAPLMINVGSGSTGAPKLIPVSHGHMRVRSEISAASPIFAEDDRTLWVSGLEFTAVQNRLFNQIHAGHALVLPPLDRRALAACIRQHAVTVVVAAVFHLESLLRDRSAEIEEAFGALRSIRTGGSNVTDSLRDRVRAQLNPNLFVKYATNESGVISVCPPDGHLTRSGSVGLPLPGVELEVLAPAGEVGPVRVRNAGVVGGYLGDAVSTSERFVDGWFHPGDLAAMSPAGEIAYYGRSDHMMIVNGVNLYPAELETCLAGHPAVADVAAIPLAHPVHQHVPVCAVVLKAQAEARRADLEAFARERLGPRSPWRVFVLPRIPRNPQGKLVRAELEAEVRAQAQRLG